MSGWLIRALLPIFMHVHTPVISMLTVPIFKLFVLAFFITFMKD